MSGGAGGISYSSLGGPELGGLETDNATHLIQYASNHTFYPIWAVIQSTLSNPLNKSRISFRETFS